MDILTKPLCDWTLGETAAILSQNERPEDLAARLAREANIERAHRIYEAALERAKRLAASSGEWDEVVGTCTVVVQPKQPAGVLIEPSVLREKLVDLRSFGNEGFPSLATEETIPSGLLFVEASSLSQSQRQCQQILSDGLLFDKHEATWKNSDSNAVSLYLPDVAKRMAAVLSFARKYFLLVSYEGDLACVVMLDDLDGCLVRPLAPEERNSMFSRRNPPKPALLPCYRFEATLSASDLRDPGALQQLCTSLVERICWGLGTHAQPDMMRAILTGAGLATPVV